MDWFLYDRDLRHERVNNFSKIEGRCRDALNTLSNVCDGTFLQK